MNRILPTAALILTLGLAVTVGLPPASAGESPLWKQFDNWSVRVNRALDGRCYMETATVEPRTKTTMGRLFVLFGKHSFILGVSDKLWQLLPRDKAHGVLFQIDSGEPRYEISRTVRSAGMGATVLAISPDFWAELMRGHSLSVQPDNQPTVTIPLAGSFAAGEELLACQGAMDASRPSPASADPFTKGAW